MTFTVDGEFYGFLGKTQESYPFSRQTRHRLGCIAETVCIGYIFCRDVGQKLFVVFNFSRNFFQSVLAVLCLLGHAAIAQQVGPMGMSRPLQMPAAEYADPASCAECHADICKQWATSDHSRSMDHATTTSVLGDFRNATFLHIGFDDIVLLKDDEIKTFLKRLEDSALEFDPRREYVHNPEGNLRYNVKGRKAQFSPVPCFDDLALATADAKAGVMEKLRKNMTATQAAAFDEEIAFLNNLRMSRPGDIAAAQDRINELLRTLVSEKVITTPLGTTFRMYQDGTGENARFMMETDLGIFEILFTLGVRPLQQYLVAIEGGRLQALPVAWDTVANRWFHLYPKEQILPDDPLHWTASLQNWNRMCADCHTTNLQKNFQRKANTPRGGIYRTTYTEINVGCQACHGPCAKHVEVGKRNNFQTSWRRNVPLEVHKLTGQDDTAITESCVFCHARRRLLKPGPKPPEVPAVDWFMTELQDANIYFADGQLLEEAFEHGSFLQSKMSSKGVGCSHCHDPHTLELRYQGNRLCAQCHAPSIYDTPKHHFHPDSSKPGTQCIECHFPKSSYMVVDPRRDHSIRIPNPALSLAFPESAAPPNACSLCHQDRTKGETLQWAADWVSRWYDEKRKARVGYFELDAIDNHYSLALEAGKRSDPAAAQKLFDIVRNRSDKDFRFPIRASALTILGRLPLDAQTNETIIAASLFALDDPLPQMRFAAVGALASLPEDVRLKHLPPLLNDPNLAVRTETARVLARWNAQLPRGEIAEAFERVKEEYKVTLQVDNDQSAIYLNLAVLEHDLAGPKLDEVNRWFYASVQHQQPQSVAFREAQTTATGLIRRLTAKSLDLYRQSLELDPAFIPSRINLAMLHHERGEVAEAEKEFREALTLAPDNGDIAYSLGLLLAESGRTDDAVEMLRRAANHLHQEGGREATRNRVRYNLGLLLLQLGRGEDAEKELSALLQAEPRHVDFLYALMSLYYQQGNVAKAIPLLDRLIEIQPDNPQWRQMKAGLR